MGSICFKVYSNCLISFGLILPTAAFDIKRSKSPMSFNRCVISNCVINLSSDKESVFREVWRILKNGGEFYFSDIYSDRRIPEHLKDDKVLWGEGLSGAMYIDS